MVLLAPSSVASRPSGSCRNDASRTSSSSMDCKAGVLVVLLSSAEVVAVAATEESKSCWIDGDPLSSWTDDEGMPRTGLLV